VHCQSSTAGVLVGVIVAMAALLAVALVAVGVMLYQLLHLRLRAAPET